MVFLPNRSQTKSTPLVRLFNTGEKIKLHVEYTSVRRGFPLGSAEERLQTVLSRICQLSEHCLHARSCNKPKQASG